MSPTTDRIDVLHVDDEPDFAAMVAEFLASEDDRIHVQTATSAREGLAQLEDSTIDCIVSDYVMPGHDGIEFLQTVREIHPDLPFILYTGKGSEVVASEAIGAGVTDYLQKERGTEQYEILAAEIVTAVEKHRTERELDKLRRQYTKLVEQNLVGIYIIQHGEFVYVNPRLAAIHGYDDPEEIIGKSPLSLVAPEERDRVQTNLERRITGDVAEVNYETIGLRQDGERIDIELHGSRIEYEGDPAVIGAELDITERKEHTRRLDTLISNLPGIVYRARNDPDWPMEFVKGECESLTGYAAAALEEGEVVWGQDIIHPDDQEQTWEAVQTSLEEERPFEVTYRIRTKDGTTKWVWERGQFVDSPATDGQILEGFIRDITDRKEREHTLERERSRLNALFQHTTDAVVFTKFVDGEPIVHEVNAAFEETFGYDEKSAVGRPIDEMVIPDGSENMQEATQLNRRIEAGELVETEVRRQTAEGIRDFLLQSIPLEPGTSGTRTYAIYSDITERKEHERELERYETLVEVSGDPMYMLDEDGCFNYVNQAFLETTGYSEAALRGEHVLSVMAEEHVERGENLIRSLLSSGTTHGTFELDIQTKRGESIPVENHISLLYSDGAFQGSLGVLRDITDRLERERKLQRERDRLDRFAGVVSHDLRNPLNVATGRLELAIQDCACEHLEPVPQALERMETLIDDVLRLARAGESVGETDAVALADLIDGCWRNVDTDSATLLAETDAVIRADESRLQQLFENLFRNAIEHAGDQITVTVGDLDDGFYVADDGPGIPESDREAVFEPGYSGGETGTGFGLSIVEEIVQAHDWEIRVAAGSEEGARFEITGVEFVAE